MTAVLTFFYFSLFPARWMNGLQTVADPGLPDSEIKVGRNRGGWVGLFWSKNKRGASPSPGFGTNRKCSIQKIKAAKWKA